MERRGIIEEIIEKTSEMLDDNLEAQIQLYCNLEQPLDAYRFWCRLYAKEKMTEKSKRLLSDILNLVYNSCKIDNIISDIEENKLSISRLHMVIAHSTGINNLKKCYN